MRSIVATVASPNTATLSDRTRTDERTLPVERLGAPILEMLLSAPRVCSALIFVLPGDFEGFYKPIHVTTGCDPVGSGFRSRVSVGDGERSTSDR
jgi:hypothetical protein